MSPVLNKKIIAFMRSSISCKKFHGNKNKEKKEEETQKEE